MTMKDIDVDKENRPTECDEASDIDKDVTSKLPCISDFEFIKPISKGAFGKVFLGQKKIAPDKMYAIKVMKKSDLVNKNLIKQVTAERDALAVSSSPFIVQLYYSLQSQQNIFLIMEYLIGGDVKSLLAIYGYFDEDMAVMYVAEVTLALEYLHARGIIHRDLKPDNMLITDQGHIKLTDFGLSKVSVDRDTMSRPMAEPGSKYHIYRTPGQILSLKSSLAFNMPSTRKAKKPALFTSPLPSGQRSSYNSPRPLSEKSPFCSPLKNVSTTSPLLRFSLTPLKRGKMDKEVKNSTAEQPPPPIRSLTPTLQDTLNWSTDTDSSGKVKRRHSSRIDGTASEAADLKISPLLQPIDSVFKDDEMMNLSCNTDQSCHSHSKTSSRQESFTDETPQLHRTDEAVWNSYAARNLRSMREGSYSEEGEPDTDLSISFCDSSVESGRFTSLSNRGSSSYSYPSDDEGDPSLSCRHRVRRRRSFEISDDSALSRRSSVGVHMMGVIPEEKHLARRDSFSKCQEGSCGSAGWRDLDHTESDVSDCDVSIGQKDEKCRLTFQSTSSEDSVPPPANTGLTQDIKILSVREACLASHASTGLTQDIKILSVREPGMAGPSILKRESNARSSQKHTSCERLACRPAPQSGLTQEINTLTLCSARKKSIKSDLQPIDEVKPEINFQEVKPEINIQPASSSKDSVKRISKCAQPKSSGLTQEFKSLDLAERLLQSSSGSLEKTKLKSLVGPAFSRKRSFDLVDGMSPLKVTGDMLERVYGDEHLRKRSYIESASSDDFDSDVSEDAANTSMDSRSKPSPVPIPESQVSPLPLPSTESLDMKSPPFTVEVCHASPIPTPQDLPPSPSAPRLCPHRRKDLALSPVHGSAQRKHYMGEDSVFKSPLPQRTRFKNPCQCQGRPGHLNSKSSLNDSPAVTMVTPERPIRRKVSLMPTPFTPGNMAKTPFLTPFRVAAQRTPFRTPKSVRRGRPQPEEEQRILGTPDYLAPEILLQKAHGTGVDWWALGVCMFEFLTGVPPFNDQSPECVFENILNRDIPWPEGEEALSEHAQTAIDRLLTMNSEDRPGAAEVRELELFSHVEWDNLLDVQPAFVPQPDDETDTTYFEARNSLQNLIVSAVDL